MGRSRSRVSKEVRSVEKRTADIEKQIRALSDQISHPSKHFSPQPDPRSQSHVERFRRYFKLDTTGQPTVKRKPTRNEMRIQRNRAIFWAMLALIALIWVVGRIWRWYR
jgi:hypothetical protein